MKLSHEWGPLGLGSSNEYLEWLYRLIRTFNPQRGLEIGFGPGGSAIAFLRATETSELFSFDCRDLSHRAAEIHTGTRLHFQNIGSPGCFNHIDGDFDWIYIDGNHTFGSVVKDWTHAREICRVGGLITFDDCGVLGEVNDAVEQFQKTNLNFRELNPSLGVKSDTGPRVFRRLS